MFTSFLLSRAMDSYDARGKASLSVKSGLKIASVVFANVIANITDPDQQPHSAVSVLYHLPSC